MRLPRPLPRTLLAALATTALLAACASPPPSAADVIARAQQAMGGAALKSLRYAGDGEGFTFGQPYQPDGAWPKVAYHAVARTIDYDTGAMRDEVTLSRAEPRGGGGYPLAGQQRNDQYLSGEFAWNVVGGNVAPGSRFVADRVHQLWITPHGALKAAQRNNATVAAGSDGVQRLTFTQPGRLRATVTVDATGLVTAVDSVYPDPVTGDTAVVTRYSDYKDFGGVKFPTRIRQSAGGFPVLDLAVKEVQPNAPVNALVLPDAARNIAERVTNEKVADGVWHLAGGSHNSVLIEMADHLVLVEAPLGDARTNAVIAAAKALVPGKPIRSVINSHAHFDHSGGLRAAVAEGATIVTMAANVPYFERTLNNPNALRPDALAAKAGTRARFQAVPGTRGQIADATRTIELHKIDGGPHSDSMLMAYLPKERLLIQADAYTPSAPNAPPPATPNANNVNLIDNIERLKLGVDRILPLHGRVVPLSELYATASRPVPR
jgi:glyoxylase-like metal-dependent hydrolase (beta-lactamase superfamily II)